MSKPKWHMSPTQAGKPGGALHYDIGASDNENIALVYPAEDGHEVTVERAKLICEARKTKRQRDLLLKAAKGVWSAYSMGVSTPYKAKRWQEVEAAIAECEGAEE